MVGLKKKGNLKKVPGGKKGKKGGKKDNRVQCDQPLIPNRGLKHRWGATAHKQHLAHSPCPELEPEEADALRGQ